MSQILPEAVVEELLARWAEPHRHYHSTAHLHSGLDALELLGGGITERIAFCFHDAVHTNTTPDDEIASAELAEALLAGHLPARQLTEVRRLILLTVHHTPDPADLGGARLCDADLSGMGADWDQYLTNIAGIRAELPQFSRLQWQQGRAGFLDRFLQREWIFHTPLGRERWEERARANMTRELEGLRR